jgi:hypothetical protein
MKFVRQDYRFDSNIPSVCHGRQLRIAIFKPLNALKQGWMHEGFERIPARFIDSKDWWLIAQNEDEDQSCEPIGPFPSLRTALVVLTLQEG